MGDHIKSTIHFCRVGLSSPCPLKEAMGPDEHPEDWDLECPLDLGLETAPLAADQGPPLGT